KLSGDVLLDLQGEYMGVFHVPTGKGTIADFGIQAAIAPKGQIRAVAFKSGLPGHKLDAPRGFVARAGRVEKLKAVVEPSWTLARNAAVNNPPKKGERSSTLQRVERKSVTL